jgi:hypothetical protein
MIEGIFSSTLVCCVKDIASFWVHLIPERWTQQF